MQIYILVEQKRSNIQLNYGNLTSVSADSSTFRAYYLSDHFFFRTFAGKNKSNMNQHLRFILSCLFCLSILCIFGQKRKATQPSLPAVEKGVTKRLAEKRAANISLVNYDLTFRIPADIRKDVSGTVVIDFFLKDRIDVVLDFQGRFSGNCTINGVTGQAKSSNEHIIIPKKLVKKGMNQVKMDFTSLNTALNRHSDYLYTLFVPDHARSCFPCFDQPDLRATFKTTLNVPEGWKTMISDSSNPIPTYLYSFVAGKFYEKVVKKENRPLRALYLETDPSKTSQLPQVFEEVYQSLRWMEKYTGIRCPFKEYGMVILPGYQFGGMEHPGAIQLNDRRIFLGQSPSQEERLTRSELIAHETAHLWFGDIVSLKWFEDVWVKETFANFMAEKITRNQLSKADHELRFLKTYQSKAIAIDRTDGTHPIAQPLDNLNKASLLYDDIIYDKAPVVMRLFESMIDAHKMQAGLQKYLKQYYFKNASWDDLIDILDAEAPTVGIRQMSDVWVRQKGMPIIHTSYKDGKLIVSQKDPYGRGLFWRQKFDIRIINDLGSSRTVTVDMQQPTVSFNLRQAPSHIIPNYNGNGYGHFTLDEDYARRLVFRLIVLRNDLQRYALLETLYDNYLMGNIPPSYFGELYRNMIKERNPFIMQTCIDHMFKIGFDMNRNERMTLEQCIMDLLGENHQDECRRIIIRKMAANATSPEVLDRIYKIWSDHNDPLFNEHDYMEMAYRLAIMRPNEWQNIISAERNTIDSDLLLKEFDYVSRACTPQLKEQQKLFNDLLKPENRKEEPWALHLLRLLNADVREPQTNPYITSSLKSLEHIQQTSDIFFTSNWLKTMFAGHKSSEARQLTEQFLKQNPNLKPHLRNKVLEAAWPLMNKRKK